MRLQKYITAHGEFAWRLRATNGKIIADSAESYKTRRKCDEAVLRVAGLLKEGVVDIAPTYAPAPKPGAAMAPRARPHEAEPPKREPVHHVSIAQPMSFKLKPSGT